MLDLSGLAEALPRLEVDAIPRAPLEAAVRENLSAIRNLLIDEGFSNPSVTLLRKAAKLFTIHKCCSCPFHGDNISQLRKHLKVNKCYYRQEKFRIQKEELLQQVRERAMDINIKKFRHLFNMELTQEERATLEKILYLQLFLIKLRWDVIVIKNILRLSVIVHCTVRLSQFILTKCCRNALLPTDAELFST